MRRILLTLPEDTTETECGDCRGLDPVIDWCGPFGVRLIDEICHSDQPGYRHARHPECLAAEAAAARMVEIAPEDIAKVKFDLWAPIGAGDGLDAYYRVEKALLAHAAKAEVNDSERIYPCNRCGKMRTKAEGGTVFTVCDACWDKKAEVKR